MDLQELVETFGKIALLTLFATPIYFWVMDDWKSALLLFILYDIFFAITRLGELLSKRNELNMTFLVLCVICFLASVIPSIVFCIYVCNALWQYDGIIMGIIFVLNICYAIFSIIGSFSCIITAADEVAKKELRN